MPDRKTSSKRRLWPFILLVIILAWIIIAAVVAVWDAEHVGR
jgi:hypothetical protein